MIRLSTLTESTDSIDKEIQTLTPPAVLINEDIDSL